MKRMNGFTLIELLVVISIISLLVAILLPALNMARRHSKSVQCMSNLRQVGLTLQVYLMDSDGEFFRPYDSSGYAWYSSRGVFNQPPTYLSITYAPGDYWKGSVVDCPGNPSGHAGISVDYAYNYSLAVYTAALPWGNLKQVREPGRTVPFADTRGMGETPLKVAGFYYFESKWGFPWSDVINYDLHPGGANHLFLDGHVATATKEVAQKDFVFLP